MYRIEQPYDALATSVFNTTHGLPIDGVKVDVARLAASLKTSEALFSHLNDSTASNAAQVSELAALLEELATLAQEEANELQAGQQMLGTIEQLEQQERSLRIQLIQYERQAQQSGVMQPV